MTRKTADNKAKLNNGMKLTAAFVGFVLVVIAVVGVSVAWLMISRTPIVSDLGLKVLTNDRLEIAPDVNGTPGEWDVTMDLSTVLNDLSPLKPVTYSQAKNQFFAMSYGLDGRADGVTVALTDDANANVKSNGSASGTENGYYIATTFWMKAPSLADISLSEAKEVEEGKAGSGTYVIGNPVWNGSALVHENGGNGMETALRLGFQCQKTDLKGNPIGDPVFYIYEPNGDSHVKEPNGYIETPSMDGGNSLVSSDRLIWQSTSSWNETTPVLNSQVVYNLGEFKTDATLFDISPSTLEKITLYVWLEGQDVDCINAASAYPTSILANIQFKPNENGKKSNIVRDED